MDNACESIIEIVIGLFIIYLKKYNKSIILFSFNVCKRYVIIGLLGKTYSILLILW